MSMRYTKLSWYPDDGVQLSLPSGPNACPYIE